MQWLLKLLPQQKMKENSGSCNLQAGCVEGDLHHNTSTQTTFNVFYLQQAEATDRAVAKPEAVPEPQAPKPATKAPATAMQHEVLRLMRSSKAAKVYVEAFMNKEFKHTIVKRLDDLECRRVRGYVEACLRNAAKQAEEIKTAKSGQ